MNNKFIIHIANHLFLYSSYLKDAGLYYGKIGIALTFFRLSQCCANDTYADYASELLSESLANLSKNISFDLEKGLCGVGWGICYLLENRFITGNPQEILEEIDAGILQYDPSRITDPTLRSGKEGIKIYVGKRISIARLSGQNHPFDERYLNALYTSGYKMQKEQKKDNDKIVFTSWRTRSDPDRFTQIPLGVDNGCAGILHSCIPYSI